MFIHTQAENTPIKTHAIIQSRRPELMNKIAPRTGIPAPSLITPFRIRPVVSGLLFGWIIGVSAFIDTSKHPNVEHQIQRCCLTVSLNGGESQKAIDQKAIQNISFLR